MLGNEAQSRILINQLLTNAGWRFNNGRDKELYFPANVIPEWDIKSPDGEKMYRADYALFDPHNYPICIVEANTPDNFSDSSQHYLHSSTNAANIQSFCKYTSNSNYSFKTKIPLPPLEEQEKIIAEIEGYQKVIDGCNMVIDNYRPTFKIDPSWEKVRLGEVCEFQYGKPPKESERRHGPFPVYSSNGEGGYHEDYLVSAPFIVVGRKGSAGALNWSDENGTPIDTTFYIKLKNESKILQLFLFYQLQRLNLDKVNTQSGVPGLNRKDAYKLEISLLPLEIQNAIVKEIEINNSIITSLRNLRLEYMIKIKQLINEETS
ncbi:MAG: restriction endonuclease subunit S [Bacteroidia bacterium]|nr:restriction endonuclease subunit S [Bacteroidia bacterium]